MVSVVEVLEPLTPGPKMRELLELSDVELAQRLFTHVRECLGHSFGDVEADEFYYLIGETLERWAPHVALAEMADAARAAEMPGDETEANLEGILGRFALRVQLQARRVDNA